MKQELLKKVIEAALMVAGRPLSINQLLDLFEKSEDKPERADLRAALTELQTDFAEHGVELKEVASGFRFQVRSDYAQWVNRLYDERVPRYSRALLETLAIIAYRQPITRGEIEDIRGVSVNTNIIKTLQEREWIKVVGHRDVPGKPELLATTKQFLDYFNLKQLSDLPSLAEIKDYDQLNPDLFAALDMQPPDETGEASLQPVNVESLAEYAQEAESQQSVSTSEQAEDDDQDDSKGQQGPDDNVVPFSG